MKCYYFLLASLLMFPQIYSCQLRITLLASAEVDSAVLHGVAYALG